MKTISCSRLFVLAGVLIASLGAAACDQQGCGQPEEDSTSTQKPVVTCGPGTYLQAGQCVASVPAQTR